MIVTYNPTALSAEKAIDLGEFIVVANQATAVVVREEAEDLTRIELEGVSPKLDHLYWVEGHRRQDVADVLADRLDPKVLLVNLIPS